MSGQDEVEVEPTATQPPVVRIVRGDPLPEEVVALVAVVSSMTSARGEAQEPAPSAWSDHRQRLRGEHHPGPGAWRASARTR